jgi:hypothetical protein
LDQIKPKAQPAVLRNAGARSDVFLYAPKDLETRRPGLVVIANGIDQEGIGKGLREMGINAENLVA